MGWMEGIGEKKMILAEPQDFVQRNWEDGMNISKNGREFWMDKF